MFHSGEYIVDGDESRLAAHGQPYVASLQIGIDLLAERIETGPRTDQKGRVIRGASRMRRTLISPIHMAKPALPEIGAAER